MTVGAGFALWAVAMVAVAAMAGSLAGARIGLLLALLLLPLPMLVTGPGNQRALLAFAIAASLARAVDFAFGFRPSGFSARLTYSLAFLAFIDTFPAFRRSRRFDGRAAANIMIAAAGAWGATVAWGASASLPVGVRHGVRCLSAGVMIFAMAEIVTSVVGISTAIFGVALRPVHDEPYRSRTVAEFWSKRWNLATARWLREHCFAPLARRGPVVALFATFAASAALHVYLIAIAANAMSALSWAAFFLAQPLVILVERRLHVRRWPRAAGGAWTIGMLLLLSPLLLNPVLRGFHLSL